MENWISIILAVLPPFLLLFIGCVARRMDWLGREADRTLSRFIICVLYPCFIIYHVLGSDSPIGADEAWIAGTFGFFAISIGFIIARLVAPVLKITKVERPAFCFCSGIFNYGFFAIPVASLFFGNDLVVKIILFNLGVEVAIWTVGILLLTSSRLEIRKIFNPPAISVLLALILQALGGKELFPKFGWEVLSMIGNCSIPMALMIIGASFYDLLKGYRPSPAFRVELGAVITRAIIVPAIFLLYANYGWIPTEVSWMSKVLLVQAAMPAGVFALVVVKNYEQDSQTGLRAIMATMVVSFISLPTWIWIGTNF
ncbi:MAG: AEC family transporter [Opitutae bacterium]